MTFSVHKDEYFQRISTSITKNKQTKPPKWQEQQQQQNKQTIKQQKTPKDFVENILGCGRESL